MYMRPCSMNACVSIINTCKMPCLGKLHSCTVPLAFHLHWKICRNTEYQENNRNVWQYLSINITIRSPSDLGSSAHNFRSNAIMITYGQTRSTYKCSLLTNVSEYDIIYCDQFKPLMLLFYQHPERHCHILSSQQPSGFCSLSFGHRL